MRLTPEQQKLVVDFVARGWVQKEIRRRVPQWLLQQAGWDECESWAMFAVCRAAFRFDPIKYPNVPFDAFAVKGVRIWLKKIRCKYATAPKLWGHAFDEELERLVDHRSEDRPSPLMMWCEKENADQRRCLDWRRRIMLYLRTVEGWSQQEVGDLFGACRQRVHQIESTAMGSMARYRLRKSLDFVA